MKYVILIIVLIMPGWLFSQQIADTSFSPEIKNPAYSFGKGPVVFIDRGHNNFHTRDGRFKPFANLLEKDGYIVQDYNGMFEEPKLKEGGILVISNALNVINTENWYLPTPSAFTKAEIQSIVNWVQKGGSLFLIADHMPMAGAGADLASEFGFLFSNGFVLSKEGSGTAFFNTELGSLKESIITKGRDPSEKVTQIVTFTGQGFQIPADAVPILVFDDDYLNFLPDTAWVFNDKTTKNSVTGWSQGAFKKFGEGRVVVFGEAAMFTAQLAGPQKTMVGMNSEIAEENYRLLLNIIHWLDGILDL